MSLPVKRTRKSMNSLECLLELICSYIVKKIDEFKKYRDKVNKIAFRVRKAKEHSKKLP